MSNLSAPPRAPAGTGWELLSKVAFFAEAPPELQREVARSASVSLFSGASANTLSTSARFRSGGGDGGAAAAKVAEALVVAHAESTQNSRTMTFPFIVRFSVR